MAFADSPRASAKRLGYAGGRPRRADVDGHDAAAPGARSSRRSRSTPRGRRERTTYREGIANVTTEDIEFARRLGYVVKLPRDRGDATRTSGSPPACTPAMIPGVAPARRRSGTPATRSSSRARTSAELMFYGRGAGGRQRATAVVGDLVSCRAEPAPRVPGVWAARASTSGRSGPMAEMTGQYYILPCASRTAPASWPRSRACSAAARSRSRACGRRGFGDRRAARVHHPPRTARARSRQAIGVLRGLPGVEEVRQRPPRSRPRSDDGPDLARRDRGVPRPAAGRPATPVVTLRAVRAARPLVRSEALSAETGCEVFLKLRGR